MKLVSFRKRDNRGGSVWHPGVFRGTDSLVDLREQVVDDGPVRSIRQILASGENGLSMANAAIESEAEAIPLTEVELGPPVPDPEKIVCVGLNYLEHAGEVEMELPVVPILFPKFRNALIGDGEEILVPPVTSEVDFEGELAVVIGERCKNVPEESALSMVAGYMPFNDVSARDIQMQTSQWTAGKALDTFAPCGPTLVTADEIEDVQSLKLETRLNGEMVQRSDTSLMIFSVAKLINFISSIMTLEPGDIIASGTPSGVGFTRNPPLFMKSGDVVEVEIESVGRLTNSVCEL